MGSMARAALQQLADEKLSDARLLYQNGRFSNAYYLAGYALELGLKACIARQMQSEVIPDKDLVKGIWVHNLQQLVGTAGLAPALRTRQTADPVFMTNWGVAATWAPDSRYSSSTQQDAADMLDAVDHQQSGVLPWIKLYW